MSVGGRWSKRGTTPPPFNFNQMKYLEDFENTLGGNYSANTFKRTVKEHFENPTFAHYKNRLPCSDKEADTIYAKVDRSGNYIVGEWKNGSCMIYLD